ncbi:hypothetical protein AB833_19870 [Chromatiales bacterium (ex Bugula neritina AB1)]|nr:hypothetical protein AB833_19870 [Chromatiales bacterium (ex Bugula neritina AB1)]
MLSWQWPWLLVLLPVPWLLRLLLPEYKVQRAAIKVPFYHSLQRADRQVARSGADRGTAVMAGLCWCCLVLAVLRPVWVGEPVSIANSGRDLLLAVDISDSMRIDDMRTGDTFITRMAAIKQVASEFIENRRGDRIGLILFGQRAYLQTPLTFDRQSVKTQLQEALPGFAGSSTAIGDAIGKAISLLRDRPASSRVLVVLTDGANTSGSEPREALEIAVEAEIKIHAIGVGSEFKQITDGAGRTRNIDPSKDLDEAMLQDLAAATGGRYFRARDPADLVEIYKVIDELEPMPEEQVVRPQLSLFHWPLSFSLVFCLLLLWRTRGSFL